MTAKGADQPAGRLAQGQRPLGAIALAARTAKRPFEHRLLIQFSRMTSPALIERITRSLAYMLRHQPEEFDLELDAQGYGDVGRVVQALNERLGEPVNAGDLVDAIHAGDRPRYEIVGSRVRALYGHSIDVEPGEPCRPPELLFVGISARDADRAMRYGLRGGRRRFLHLALTPDDAKEGGRRTGREYVVITVYSLDAWEEGINFYDRKALYLAEQLPIEFLEIGEVCNDGIEPEVRSPQAPRGNYGEQRRGGSPRQSSRAESGPPRNVQQPESFEEEGFGEGTPEAIQVDRDRAVPPQREFDRGAPAASRDGREGGGGNGSGRGRRGGRQQRESAPRSDSGSALPTGQAQQAQGWRGDAPAEPAHANRGARSSGNDRGEGRGTRSPFGNRELQIVPADSIGLVGPASLRASVPVWIAKTKVKTAAIPRRSNSRDRRTAAIGRVNGLHASTIGNRSASTANLNSEATANLSLAVSLLVQGLIVGSAAWTVLCACAPQIRLPSSALLRRRFLPPLAKAPKASAWGSSKSPRPPCAPRRRAPLLLPRRLRLRRCVLRTPPTDSARASRSCPSTWRAWVDPWLSLGSTFVSRCAHAGLKDVAQRVHV